jgi:4-amino-4-deoxy-L-arabinose transferase-like glycosyltransferase
LRLSTVVLSQLGVLAFYELLRREARISRHGAGFTAAALALNPLFFALSGTFMSDVPALSLSLLALAAYTRALRSGRLLELTAAALLGALAAITRQNVVDAPLVAGILLLRSPHLRRRAL